MNKTCRQCGEEKSQLEFYANRYYPDGLMAVCKSCQKIRAAQSRENRRLRKNEPLDGTGEIPELLVVEQLKKLGVPARRTSADVAYVDVEAWGCVRIEVKSSKLHHHSSLEHEQYKFAFSPDQKGEMVCDIIVLVLLEPQISFHVFPSNHHIFFYRSSVRGHTQGARKSAVVYTPNAKHLHRNAVTEDLLLLHKNTWELVEECRLMISAKLRNTFG